MTEMVTGLDLVAEQILIAAGARLALPPKGVVTRGHAIECRINAEDPVTFAPSPGLITEYHPPGGAGVRVDSGVYGGWRVPPNYDSLLAKVIVRAPPAASRRLRDRRASSTSLSAKGSRPTSRCTSASWDRLGSTTRAKCRRAFWKSCWRRTSPMRPMCFGGPSLRSS